MEDPPYMFKTNILPNDLNKQSTTLELVCILQHIDSVIEQVFEDILKRLNDYSLKVEGLQNRTDRAQKKIEKLKFFTSSTKVFSSPTFPGNQKYQKLLPIFSFDTERDPNPRSEINANPVRYDSCDIMKKMEFFHARDSLKQKTNPHLQGKALKPDFQQISVVSSLLLFNTSHNPYEDHSFCDPLGGVETGNERREKVIDQKEGLQDAPSSIKDGSQVSNATKDEFQYIPELQGLPELDLPSELPSLPAVANDFSYSVDDIPTIAPSMRFLDLPCLESLGTPSGSKSDVDPFSGAESDLLASSDVKQVKIESKAPPPLPSLSPPRDAPPPPPPPPPPVQIPPPPPPQPSVSQPTDKSKQAGQSIAPANSRMELMKAIQDAGGAGRAKLRKVSQKTPKQKDASLVKSKASAGDLMSDLFDKLSQRRKGISGALSTNKSSDVPASESGTRTRRSGRASSLSNFQDSDSVSNDTDDDWD